MHPDAIIREHERGCASRSKRRSSHAGLRVTTLGRLRHREPRGELLGRGHTLGRVKITRSRRGARRSRAAGTVSSARHSTPPSSRVPSMAAHPRAQSIAERGIAQVVIGMHDPHPRVNGAGTLILRDANVEVIEGVCEPEVRRQLGLWVLAQHPHEPLRRAQKLPEAATSRSAGRRPTESTAVASRRCLATLLSSSGRACTRTQRCPTTSWSRRRPMRS